MSVVFYPTVIDDFPYAGVLEQHAPMMVARTLREGAPIRGLLDHDHARPHFPSQSPARTRAHAA